MILLGIEKDVELLKYTDLLFDFFPGTNLYVGFMAPFDSKPEITCLVDDNESLFKNSLTVDGIKASNEEEETQIVLRLAKRISREWETRTICDGKGYVDSDQLYSFILWDRGKSFLVDESDISASEGGLKIIREVELPV